MEHHLMPSPAPGQIWRENDPRQERYVQVLENRNERVKIITVDKITHAPKKGARVSWADLFRFGSYARGKYSFVGGAS